MLHCPQLARGGLTARLQPALMGQEGSQGVSLISWCFSAELFLQSPRSSSGSSTGTAPGWMRADDNFCKQFFPKNKPITYFIFIWRGDKNESATKTEPNKQCDLHHHECSTSMCPTPFPSACLPFQPLTSGGQELSLTGCLCRSEHNGALILPGSF